MSFRLVFRREWASPGILDQVLAIVRIEPDPDVPGARLEFRCFHDLDLGGSEPSPRWRLQNVVNVEGIRSLGQVFARSRMFPLQRM